MNQQPSTPLSTTAFVPSGINQPGLATPSTSFISPAINCTIPSTHSLTSNQPTVSISTTSPIPPSVGQLQSIPSSAFVPPTDNQPVIFIATTDPSTLAMFRDYGSASLLEWLD